METGKALARIVAHVGGINNVVTAIATSAQEQSVGLQEVNVAVMQMDQMTQQNAAMVDESTAASRTMLAEAEQLSSLLGRFKMNDGGKILDLARAKVAQKAPARSTAFSGAAASQGAALRKLQPAQAEESWDEF